jgi:hypothetical protein
LQLLIRKTVALAAASGGEMMMADDATPEELWQRLAVLVFANVPVEDPGSVA